MISARRLLFLAVFNPLAFCQPDHCSGCEWSVVRPVNTTSGLVHGHPAANISLVSEYLGIPFARPPINELRFAPPVRYNGVSNISGQHFGFACPQTIELAPSTANLSDSERNILNTINSVGLVPSEDCLTLNVWTKPQTGSSTKPVMVWIHGGSFESGGSSSVAYNGQYWADEEDVVFVTLNYRLGVFGFPGAFQLTQNVALFDQRMAVEWVRDNIQGFGGDPNRIILFGESAGAGSTDYYTYIWLDDPIIQATIMESGVAGSGNNLNPELQAGKWQNLTKAMGCTDENAKDVLSCMRDSTKITMDKLLKASAQLKKTSGSSTPDSLFKPFFGPTIDNKTVFGDYTKRAEEGKLIKKPILTGNNDNEGGFAYTLPAARTIPSLPALVKEITKTAFTCPSNVQAWLRWKQKIPTWRYRYFPSFPNINLNGTQGRAYHGAEIFPMFNTDQASSRSPSTNAERAVGRYLRGAWATFAHCPDTGLTDILGWPQYSPMTNGTRGLILLGKEPGQRVDFDSRGSYDEGCAQLK